MENRKDCGMAKGWVGVYAWDEHTSFKLLVLNEADTFKSSPMLIYQHIEQSIYTLKRWFDANAYYKRGWNKHAQKELMEE
jgi:hypothetical protein